ncbi:MAG: hypothetical protein LLF90_04760 [Methanomicrobiaceae archaeon]|uniref:hypothetical protein n=1 Tax=Methanoculleus sp. TaxID=90427 RepID=UPI00320D0257|nr:hypothetical protein [Methanomicrobiaceae archaeon]
MQTNYALSITALVPGAAVLICGCTDLPGDAARNQTNGTPAGASAGEDPAIDGVLVRDGNFSTTSTRQGNAQYYAVNRAFPIYEELTAIILKTEGGGQGHPGAPRQPRGG